MLENLNKYQIVLASKSPRRQQLLADLGIEFKVITYDVDEVFPNDLEPENVAAYLAKLKAEPFREKVSDNTLVITSDTVVRVDNQILGKPKDAKEAYEMLQLISGRMHVVSTGVCLYNALNESSFTVSTKVWFKKLSEEEINYYIKKYQPFDKAGAYGIQEWIGLVAIKKIEGSYFNVMGLPVNQLYKALQLY